MRLSRQTNMSVRTLIYCANSEPNLSPVPQIAKTFGVTDMYLFKLILPVVRSGLIETVRGRRGGIRLGKPAEDIHLLEVLRITEEEFALSECMDAKQKDCACRETCLYSTALDRGLAAFFSVIGEYTIADLARSPGTVGLA